MKNEVEVFVDDLSEYGINILTSKDEKFNSYLELYSAKFNDEQKKIVMEITPWIIVLVNSSDKTINSLVFKWNLTSKEEMNPPQIDKIEDFFQPSNVITTRFDGKVYPDEFLVFYPSERMDKNTVFNFGTFGGGLSLPSSRIDDKKILEFLNMDVRTLDIGAIKKKQITKIKRMELKILAVKFEDGSLIGDDQEEFFRFEKQLESQKAKPFLEGVSTANYYLYVSLIGDDNIFQSLYDFLNEIEAEKIEGYPLWTFRGKADNQHFYTNKLNEIFLPLLLKNAPDLTEVVRWNILLMGPQGFNGHSK